MREDDRLRHVVPLLRRTIILVAVIIAVPVILWTITAFVRTYVGPPRIPTFHQLAATATINGPAPGTGAQATASLPQNAGGSDAVVEARATISDAAGRSDQLAESAASPQGGAPSGDTSGVFPPSPLAAPASGGTSGTLAGGDEGSDTLAAATPLPGPIPLPRRRPRDVEMRTADNAPANVPIPRRRPESANAGGAADTTTSSSPLGFFQNVFH